MSEAPPFVIPTEPAPSRKGWLRPQLISSWTEFVIVSGLLLLFPIRGSTLAALGGSSGNFAKLFMSDHQLLLTIFVESIALGLFLFYLHWRGWRPYDFRINLGLMTSAQGIALLLLGYGGLAGSVMGMMGLVYALQSHFHTFLSFLMAFSPHFARHAVHLDWLTIFTAMIVNAFAEEIVCMGYIFNQLAARRGPIVALIITVFLRVACHTYQDPIHLAGIAVLFTIYAVFYWYVRKLWPLIFAHMLLDIISMSLLKLLFG